MKVLLAALMIWCPWVHHTPSAPVPIASVTTTFEAFSGGWVGVGGNGQVVGTLTSPQPVTLSEYAGTPITFTMQINGAYVGLGPAPANLLTVVNVPPARFKLGCNGLGATTFQSADTGEWVRDGAGGLAANTDAVNLFSEGFYGKQICSPAGQLQF